MVALLTVLTSLVVLGGAVAYGWQRMRPIRSEVCAPPRTSWVPFLRIDLASCIAW